MVELSITNPDGTSDTIHIGYKVINFDICYLDKKAHLKFNVITNPNVSTSSNFDLEQELVTLAKELLNNIRKHYQKSPIKFIKNQLLEDLSLFKIKIWEGFQSVSCVAKEDHIQFNQSINNTIEIIEEKNNIDDKDTDSVATKNNLLHFSLTTKDNDIKFIAHVFGDSFITDLLYNGQKLEGHYSLLVLERVLNYLAHYVRKAEHASLIPLNDALSKTYHRAKRWEDELLAVSRLHISTVAPKLISKFEQYGEEIVKELKTLSTNESIILLSGWENDLGGGHALYQKITKRAGTYDVSVYNTGAGLQFHPYTLEWQSTAYNSIPIIKHKTALHQKNIPAGDIEDNLIWAAFVEFTNGRFNHGRGLDQRGIEAEDIYLNFFKRISPHFGSENGDENKWRKKQRAGTCTYKGLMALLADELPQTEYKRFKLNLRMTLLQEIQHYVQTITQRFDTVAAAVTENYLKIKECFSQLMDYLKQKKFLSNLNKFYLSDIKQQVGPPDQLQTLSSESLDKIKNDLDCMFKSAKITDKVPLEQLDSLYKAIEKQKVINKKTIEPEVLQSELRLFELAIEKTARALSKLKTQKIVNDIETEDYLSQLEKNHLNLKRLKDKLYAYWHIKLSKPKALEIANFAPLIPEQKYSQELSCKEQKDKYSHNFLKKIDEIYQNINNLPATLQEAAEIAEELLKSDQFGLTNYFIETLLRKLPSVDLREQNIWRTLNKVDTKKSMAALNKLTQTWLRIRFIEKDVSLRNNRDLKQVIYTQKALAIMHQLYSNFNVLSHNIALLGFTHDLPKSADKEVKTTSPYIAICDVHLDQELATVAEYFHSDRKNKAMAENSPKFFSFEIIANNHFDNLTADLEPLEEEEDAEILFVSDYLKKQPELLNTIKTELYENFLNEEDHAKAADIPLNWVVVYLMSSYGNKYLPADFVLLKQQSYLTQLMLHFQFNEAPTLRPVKSKQKRIDPMKIEDLYTAEFYCEADYNPETKKTVYSRASLFYNILGYERSEGPDANYNLPSLSLQLSPIKSRHRELIKELYDNNSNINKSDNHNLIMTKAPLPGISLQEARAILLLFCADDKFIQAAKVINFFNGQQEKLNDKAYQTLCYLALFENQVLIKHLKREPILASQLLSFFSSSYTLFRDKNNLPGIQFCLRILGILERFVSVVRQQGIEVVFKAFHCIEALNKLISKAVYTDRQKAYLHYEKLFFYAQRNEVNDATVFDILESVLFITKQQSLQRLSTELYMDKEIDGLIISTFTFMYKKMQNSSSFNAWLNQHFTPIFNRIYSIYPQPPTWALGEFLTLKTSGKAPCSFNLGDQTVLFAGKNLVAFPSQFTNQNQPYHGAKKILPTEVLTSSKEAPFKFSMPGNGYTSTRTYEFIDLYGVENFIHMRQENDYVAIKKMGDLNLVFVQTNQWSDSLTGYGLELHYQLWMDYNDGGIYFLEQDHSKISLKLNKNNALEYIADGDKKGLLLVNKKELINFYDVERFDKFYRVWKNENNQAQFIDLPSFDLHFRVITDDNLTSCSFESIEYIGYTLDETQSLKSLLGFENYLILTKADQQLILIPKYSMQSYSKQTDYPWNRSKYNNRNIGGGIYFQEKNSKQAEHHSFYTYTIDKYKGLSGTEDEADIYLAYIYINLRRFDCAQRLLLKCSFKIERYTLTEVTYLKNIISLDSIKEPQVTALKLFAAYCLYKKGEHLLSSEDLTLLPHRLNLLLTNYYANFNNATPFHLPINLLKYLHQQLKIKAQPISIENKLAALEQNNKLNTATLYELVKPIEFPIRNTVLKLDWLSEYFTIPKKSRKTARKFVMDSNPQGLFNFGARPENNFFFFNFLALYKLVLMPRTAKNIEEQQKLITLIRLSLNQRLDNTPPDNEQDIKIFLYLVFFNQDKFPPHAIFVNAIKKAQNKIKSETEENILIVKNMAKEFIEGITCKISGIELINPLRQESPYLAGFRGPLQLPDTRRVNTTSFVQNCPMDTSVDTDVNASYTVLFEQINLSLAPFITIKEESTNRSPALKSLIQSRLEQAKKSNHKTLNRKIDYIIQDIESYYKTTQTKTTLQITEPKSVLTSINSLCTRLDNQLLQQENNIVNLYLYNPNRDESLLTKRLRLSEESQADVSIDDMIYAYYCYKSQEEPLKNIARNLQFSISNHSKLFELKTQIENYLIYSCQVQRLKRMQKILRLIIDLDKNYNNPEEKHSAADNLSQDFLYEYKAQKAYDLNTHFEYLIFEYYNNLIIRKAQIENIEMIAQNNSKGTVIQMKPGDGKSQVILPLLSLKLATGKHLALFIVPEELMDSTAKRLFYQLYTMTRKAPVRLSWEKTNLPDLKKLYGRLIELTSNRQLLLVTDKELHLFFLQERAVELSYIEQLNQRKMTQAQNASFQEQLKLFRQIRHYFKYQTRAIAEEADLIYDQHHQVHIAYGNSIPVKQIYHDLAALIFRYLATDAQIMQMIKFDFIKESKAAVFTKERFETIKNILAKKIIDHLFSHPLSPQDRQSTLGELKRNIPNLMEEQKNLIYSYILGNYSQTQTTDVKTEECLRAEHFVNTLPPDVQDALSFIQDEIQVYLDITVDQKFERHFGFFSDEKYLIDYFLSQFNANKGSTPTLINLLIDVLEEREIDINTLLTNSKWPDALRKEITTLLENRKTNETTTQLSSKQNDMMHNLFNAIDLAGPFSAANKPKFGSELGNPIEIINLSYKGYLLSGIPKTLFKRELKRLQTQAAYEKNTTHNVALFNTRAHLNFLNMCGEEWSNLPWLDLTQLQMNKLLQSINASSEKIINFTRTYILPSLYTPAKRLTSNDKMLVDLFTNENGTFIYGMTGTPDKADTYHPGVNVKQAKHVDGQTLAILCDKSLDKLTFVHSESAVELLNEIFAHPMLKKTNAIIDNGALLKELSNRAIAEIVLEKTDPAKIEAVIFFQEDQQMVIQRGVQDVKRFTKGIISPSACFTVYDEVHCTGIDIDQGLLAQAIYTKDIHTTYREDKQGPWRFRRLDKGQSIIPIMHKSLQEILVNSSQDKTLSLINKEASSMMEDIAQPLPKAQHVKKQTLTSNKLNPKSQRLAYALLKHTQLNDEDTMEPPAKRAKRKETNTQTSFSLNTPLLSEEEKTIELFQIPNLIREGSDAKPESPKESNEISEIHSSFIPKTQRSDAKIFQPSSQKRQLDFLDSIIFSLLRHCDDLETDIIAAFRTNLLNITYRTCRNWLDKLPLNCYLDPLVQALVNYFVTELTDNASKVGKVAQLLPVEKAISLFHTQTVGAYHEFLKRLIQTNHTHYNLYPLCNTEAKHFIDKVKQQDILPAYIKSNSVSAEQGIAVEQTIMVQEQQQVQEQSRAETSSEASIKMLFATDAIPLISQPWTIEQFRNLIANIHTQLAVASHCCYRWLNTFLEKDILATPDYHETRLNSQCFDIFQKKIGTVLIVQPKESEQSTRFVILANNNVRMLQHYLQLPNIVSDAPFSSYYFCLYYLGVGPVQNGPQSIPDDKYQTDEYQKTWVKLKFLNGVLNYTETERALLLNLFKKFDFNSLEQFEKKFVTVILNYDQEGKQKYANSILKSIFSDAKAWVARAVPQTAPQVMTRPAPQLNSNRFAFFNPATPFVQAKPVQHSALKNDISFLEYLSSSKANASSEPLSAMPPPSAVAPSIATASSSSSRPLSPIQLDIPTPNIGLLPSIEDSQPSGDFNLDL